MFENGFGEILSVLICCSGIEYGFDKFLICLCCFFLDLNTDLWIIGLFRRCSLSAHGFGTPWNCSDAQG